MKRIVSAIATGAVLAGGLIAAAAPAMAASVTPSPANSGSAFPFSTGAAHKYTGEASIRPAAHAAIAAAEQPSLDNFILSANGKTTLKAGEFLISSAGAFGLYLDPEGPLELFAAYQEEPLWSVGSSTTNPVLTLQGDGNVVLRDGTGHASWATNTTGAHAALAFGFLFDNGEVAALGKAGVVYTNRTAKVARTDAVVDQLVSPEQSYVVTMQQDGNLVIRHLAGGKAKAIWASGTAVTKVPGPHGVFLTLQSDDNLVIRFGATVLWSTHTHMADPGLPYLVMQDDGNLVLRELTASGKAKVLWASGTAGKI